MYQNYNVDSMEIIKRNNLFLLEEIIKRNFSSKYKDSVIGIFWSVLKPLLIMVLLTIIFSTIFGSSIKNYPVYFLSGKCIMDFFNFATTLAMDSIKGNKNILKQTTSSKYAFVLGGVISEFLNFLITLLILVAVMIILHSEFHLNTIMLSVIPLFSLICMITGISLILSILCVYYTDIKHLWNVLTVMLVYASAIFYPMSIIPQPYYKYMILNPIYWIIDQFRELFIWGNIPNPLYMLNSILLSSIILVVGIIIFKKYANKVALMF